MKIERIRTTSVPVNHRGSWIFVHVDTDKDISGIGEVSHSSDDDAVIHAIKGLGDRLIGTDPCEISAFRSAHRSQQGGRVLGTAISGIEQALWDILGQDLEVPVYQLLGGKIRDRIRLYANINRHLLHRTPEDFARAAAEAVREGFTGIKIAPFDEVRFADRTRTGGAAAHTSGIERVAAVREAIGPNVELAVDCHARFEPAEAIAVAKKLEEFNLFWFEEPVHWRNAAGLAKIGEAVNLPIASAESVYGLHGFAPFLTSSQVDVLMPDVKHCGGIAELCEIAAAARATDLLIAPHNPSGPVSTAASAQAIAGVSNFSTLEYAWGEVSWRKDLLEPPERIEEGYLVVSDRSGLGHRLRDDYKL